MTVILFKKSNLAQKENFINIRLTPICMITLSQNHNIKQHMSGNTKLNFLVVYLNDVKKLLSWLETLKVEESCIT